MPQSNKITSKTISELSDPRSVWSMLSLIFCLSLCLIHGALFWRSKFKSEFDNSCVSPLINWWVGILDSSCELFFLLFQIKFVTSSPFQLSSFVVLSSVEISLNYSGPRLLHPLSSFSAILNLLNPNICNGWVQSLCTVGRIAEGLRHQRKEPSQDQKPHVGGDGQGS